MECIAKSNEAEDRDKDLSLTSSLLLLNVIGACGYLIVGSQHWWIEPELADIPGASGGAAFVWFGWSVYFAVAFVAVNLAAVICHFISLVRKSGPRLNLFAFSIPLIWLVAIWIDFQHHGV